MNKQSDDPIRAGDLDPRFGREVQTLAGTNLHACLQCKSCAAGCPFSEFMDYRPNGVIRLTQLGLKQDVLACSTIWLCVGCHTCSIQCPMAIDIAAVMDVLRQKALAENAAVVEPDILNFHREVLNSIKRYGRTHKLEIMLRYKLQKRDWFSDLDVGLKMLAKRKLDLTPSRVRHVNDVKGLFNEDHHEKTKGSKARK
jgi:heterodisulfide reductase subunit C